MYGTRKTVSVFNTSRSLMVASVLAMTCSMLQASTIVKNNTPGYVVTAKSLGAEDPAKIIEVSVWLKLHNRDQFDVLTESLYDRNSPNYRHWLTGKDIERFAPTAGEAKTVQQFFAAHNLQVVKTGPNNFYVRARGTVADVQKAFHVHLINYQVGQKTIRANDGDPQIDGVAGTLARAVSGLDSGKFEHALMARPTTPGDAKSAITAKLETANDSNFFTSQCFTGTETDTLSTNGDGELPIGTYTGNKINLESATSPGCAYTPPVIQTAYNLSGLYNGGYDGTGQTIAIVDWCGSYTIESDANAFSKKFGLPKLTSSNFNIIYTSPSQCIAYDQVEINLDVEWAHAVAPGANINLIVPPSNGFQDVDEAEFDVANYGWGNVLSGSYVSPELYTTTTELDTENLLSELGAATGISYNFASGDDGDYVVAIERKTVSAPADSPWSTAVGGVSLALNSDNSIAWQSGWGTYDPLLAEEGTVYDPPKALFFGGSGGGPSNCVTKNFHLDPPLCTGGFSKPAYQKSLSGTNRLLPDVSWLADPFTGVAILISIPGQIPEQVWQVYGGTSVATPMFSALWAIANQEAVTGGGTELGQAAPYLYSLPSDTIYDIVPVTSATNVTGTIQDSTGKHQYSAKALVGNPKTEFVSALWDYFATDDTALVLSFGTDGSLKTAPGWDDVTGVGTPNAQAFADFFYAQ